MLHGLPHNFESFGTEGRQLGRSDKILSVIAGDAGLTRIPKDKQTDQIITFFCASLGKITKNCIE